MSDTDLGKEIGDLTSLVRSRMDEVKSVAETHATELKNLGKVTDETKANADRALLDLNEIKSRLADAEQKLARRGQGQDQPAEVKSMGQLIVESDDFKSGKLDGMARGSIRLRMSQDETKDIMSAGAGPALVTPDRRGMVLPGQQALTIRDLLLPGTTSSSSIEYPQETGFTNNAAPVAEGAVKPKSDIAFDQKSAAVRTIAHIFKASRQILDDAPMLRTYIDGRGRYGLKLAEERQILTGNGTGANLLGLVPQATPFAVPTGLTGATDAIGRLRAAILQVYLSEFPASGMVLNPIDMASFELLKDGEGRNLYSTPFGAPLQKRLWNLPVVETISMAQNAFLVGAFNIGAQIFDRMDVEVLLSTENADDFERNLCTIRIEERLALAVYRPASFVTGAITASP